MNRFVFEGGIGNQILQLAAYLYYKNIEGIDLYPNFSWYQESVGVYRNLRLFELFDPDFLESNEIFLSDSKKAGPKYINSIACKISRALSRVGLKYSGLYKVLGVPFVELWQDEKFFNYSMGALRMSICRDFDSHDLVLLKEKCIPGCFGLNDVAIHLRFGDYIGNPRYYNVIGSKYILNALDIIGDVDRLFVVTDDVDLAREKLDFFVEADSVFFISTTELLDFKVLMMFKKVICANSTFSLVASRLGDAQIVVQPDNWTSNKKLLRFNGLHGGPDVHVL